jgi:hypothetical protein
MLNRGGCGLRWRRVVRATRDEQQSRDSAGNGTLGRRHESTVIPNFSRSSKYGVDTP